MKANYERPSLTVVTLHHAAHLLAGSPTVKSVAGDDWNWDGDPGDDR